MDLRHLIDKVLLVDTKKLVLRERECTSRILHYLREIDRRKLFAELGFSSLFSYCTKDLKYSPDQAQRRIVACRLLGELPEIEAKLDSGSLNLTHLGLFSSHCKSEGICGIEEKRAVLSQLENTSTREAEKILAVEETAPAAPKVTLRRRSKNSTRLSITLDDRVLGKLEKLQAHFSHSKKRELAQLVEYLCDQELARLEKRKVGRVSHSPAAPQVTGDRALTAKLKREALARARHRCEYRDPKTGKKCGAIHFLQIHHRLPLAYGGKHDLRNLQVLCHAHHRRVHHAQRDVNVASLPSKLARIFPSGKLPDSSITDNGRVTIFWNVPCNGLAP